LAKQDGSNCNINGIAAESKNPARDEFIGVLGIDANPKTLPERNQTPLLLCTISSWVRTISGGAGDRQLLYNFGIDYGISIKDISTFI
jgi:hypothetical protein